MKKVILILTLLLTTMWCFGTRFHGCHVHHVSHISHSSYHPAVHPVFHHGSSSHVRPITARPAVRPRTTPIFRQPTHDHFMRNMMMYYIITRPQHHDDTYVVDGKELKVCPKCHKRLILKTMRVCNSCAHHYEVARCK